MNGGRIVVDTSAVISMTAREADAEWFVEQLSIASQRWMSAGTVQEYLLVASMRGPHDDRRDVVKDAWQLLALHGIDVAPVTHVLAVLGAAATVRFRSAPARLNFGAGFTYALAQAIDAPILCKGNDFAATDVKVLRPS